MTDTPDDLYPGATPADAAMPKGPARRRYAFVVLWVVGFFAYMDRMAIAIVMEPIKKELHLSDWQLGLLSGLAFAAFYATLGLPLARLADRSSRIRLLSACIALWSVMMFLSGAAQSFVQLFLARVGIGVGEAGCVPASHSMVSDLFPRRRAFMIGLFQVGAAAGTSMGLLLVGLMAASIGWRMALQVVGVAGLPIALLAFLTVREPVRTSAAPAHNEPARAAFGALLRRPALVHLILGYALSSIASYGFTQWVPTFLIRSFRLGLAEVGALSGGVSAVSGMLGLFTGGIAATWLVRRDVRWELWLPALTFGASTPIYLAMFLSGDPYLALTLKLFANFFSAVGSGVALAAVHSFAESNRRASAVALMLFASSLLGLGGGPFLIGLLSDAMTPAFGGESLRYALLTTCLVLIWAVAHFLLAARRCIRDRVPPESGRDPAIASD